MVYRIYVEKKPGFDGEAQSLRNELVSLLGIKELNGLRLLNRYDVEGIDEALFEQCVPTVFSEPPVDNTYAELPVSDGVSFAVEYLPGQFDQRADSAAECIQLISQGDRPLVRSARVYLLEGTLTDEQVAEIKKYVINPVEAREASLDTKATLKMEHPVPTEVEVLDGFNELDEAGLKKFIDEKGLAMDLGDIKFCQEYFRSEKRDPTITEIKMIDTYWSDHCRHTTFGTILDDVQIDDAVVQEAFDRYMAMRADLGRENKPRCMMDLATIGAKELKKQGKPFLILVNSKKPYGEEAQKLVKELEDKYQAAVLGVNCEQLRKEDVIRILEKILYEFPVRQIEYYIPKWVELLPITHYLKEDLLKQMKEQMGKMEYIRDIRQENLQMDSSYVKSITLEEINLSNGVVKVRIQIGDPYYYQVMSEMTGVPIESEYQLIHTLKELAQMKQEYAKVQHAIESVRGTGYGVVIPEKNEITLEEPVVIRQGNKYGVKIKSASPSIHMIKANIETEIAPIVGSEEQAQDLIAFIKENEKTADDGMWETNIFGKSIEQLVEDGIRTKIAQISEESQVKLQDTMQKIVNDSKGGLICIII